jgi:type I restriction enzyme S subunit
MSQPPANWTSVPLLAVCTLLRGVTYTKEVAATSPAVGLLPVLRANNLQGRVFDFSDLVYVPSTFVSEQQLIRAGDVVVATSSGSISVVGKAVQARFAMDAGFGAFCGVLRPAVALESRYFGYYFSSEAYRSRVSTLARGSNINNLKREHFESLTFAVAPYAEQKRIADKLDTVLTRVDAVKTRLARVAPLLKRFRQSVLAAATSGRLTEDWRSLNASTTPWRQKTLGDLIDEMRNGLATKPDENREGRKILRISAVRPGVLDTTDHRYLSTDERDAKLYELRKGDLLFTRYNGSLEYVGVCAMVSEDLPAYVYPDKLIRVRAKAAVALPKFIELASAAAEARSQIEGYVKSSAGQKGISGGNLKSLRIAVPSIEEQTEIVRRIDTLFAFADRLEARLQTAQTAANRITPSLLAKAFRGELVPQDPNDEPASELLKRLAASAPASASKRGRAKSSTAA